MLSQVFSPPMFDKIVRGDDFSDFIYKINNYYSEHTELSNKEIIVKLYTDLILKYRCEYIYKNQLFNQIVEEHGLEDTLTLNELKIATSKADLTLLNGVIRVYEIKTELDGLFKLEKQLNDYQKFADKVYIVTNEPFSLKLLSIYRNSNIGIIVFAKNNKLSILKDAHENDKYFDFSTIFKILRKKEYLDLVQYNFNYIPNVSNTKIFRTCYDLLSTVDILKFQKQVLDILKNRKLESIENLKSNNTPYELKHICNSLNFNEFEYQKLYNFLDK